MSATNSKMLFAEAQAAHEGDRAALLAAINEVASGLKAKKSTASQNSALMKSSQVNANVARDLISNANSRVGDMNDFARRSEGPNDQGKTLLNNRVGLDSESR